MLLLSLQLCLTLYFTVNVRFQMMSHKPQSLEFSVSMDVCFFVLKAVVMKNLLYWYLVRICYFQYIKKENNHKKFILKYLQKEKQAMYMYSLFSCFVKVKKFQKPFFLKSIFGEKKSMNFVDIFSIKNQLDTTKC